MIKESKLCFMVRILVIFKHFVVGLETISLFMKQINDASFADVMFLICESFSKICGTFTGSTKGTFWITTCGQFDKTIKGLFNV